MPILTRHSVWNRLRPVIAAGMTVLYLAIVMTPLASFAMHPAGSSQAAIRECSGDCGLCGCSPESRAANTCCCAKKRQQEAHIHDSDEQDVPDCCKTEQHEKKETVISCGCPCGNGKPFILTTSGSSDILPFHFTEQINIPHSDTLFANLVPRLTSRHGEPPDQPPKPA